MTEKSEKNLLLPEKITEKDFALFGIHTADLPPYSTPEEFSSKLKICSLLEDDVVVSSNSAQS